MPLAVYEGAGFLFRLFAFFIGLYTVVRFVKWAWHREKKTASEKQTPNVGASNQSYGTWTQQQWEEWAFQTFPWLREMKDAYEAQRHERLIANVLRFGVPDPENSQFGTGTSQQKEENKK